VGESVQGAFGQQVLQELIERECAAQSTAWDARFKTSNASCASQVADYEAREGDYERLQQDYARKKEAYDAFWASRIPPSDPSSGGIHLDARMCFGDCPEIPGPAPVAPRAPTCHVETPFSCDTASVTHQVEEQAKAETRRRIEDGFGELGETLTHDCEVAVATAEDAAQRRAIEEKQRATLDADRARMDAELQSAEKGRAARRTVRESVAVNDGQDEAAAKAIGTLAPPVAFPSFPADLGSRRPQRIQYGVAEVYRAPSSVPVPGEGKATPRNTDDSTDQRCETFRTLRARLQATEAKLAAARALASGPEEASELRSLERVRDALIRAYQAFQSDADRCAEAALH
jgi:hypothetical protein